jgi:hypothetical protein
LPKHSYFQVVIETKSSTIVRRMQSSRDPEGHILLLSSGASLSIGFTLSRSYYFN